MKKKMALVLILVLVISNSMVAFGAENNKETNGLQNGGTDSQEVTATYNATSSGTPTYSVNISWGALNFKYTNNGSWNTNDHNYGTSGSWDHTTKDATNTITVTNNSDVKVKPVFSIADNTMLPDGVTLNIKKAESTIIATATKTALVTTDSGEDVNTAADGSSTGIALQREAFVTLTGNPTTVFRAGKIASVTVTINAVP